MQQIVKEIEELYYDDKGNITKKVTTREYNEKIPELIPIWPNNPYWWPPLQPYYQPGEFIVRDGTAKYAIEPSYTTVSNQS